MQQNLQSEAEGWSEQQISSQLSVKRGMLVQQSDVTTKTGGTALLAASPAWLC